MRKFIDISGQKYGKLTVIKRALSVIEKSGRPRTMFYVVCECGKKTCVSATNLRKGYTKSCGCIRGKALIGRYKTEPGERGFKSVLIAYRKQSRNKGRKFELTEEQVRVLTKQNCYYCSAEPSNVTAIPDPSERSIYIYNGIDRIDSSKGYNINNVVACCINCNKAKSSLTQQDFFSMIKKIYEYHKLGDK